jgi:Cyclopropane fatty acid synthase and related methyltransferases
VAKHHDVRVTTITISREQFDYAKTRIANAGLNHLVEIRFQDYRDVTEKFDGIASIEMFEAVREAYWPPFFGQFRDRLKPGGRAALQIITIENHRFAHYRQKADYIQKYIFPGGMLPSPGALHEQVGNAGLRVEETLSFGRSYAETLRRWNDEFQYRWPDTPAMGFDTRFMRMWEQYLAYCEAGFQTGAIEVGQVALVHN